MPKPRKKSPRKKSAKRKSFDFLRFLDFKVIGVLVLLFALVILYYTLLRANVAIRSEKIYVYLPATNSQEELIDTLKERNLIGNGISLKMLANWVEFRYPQEGGLYLFEKDWNNYQLIKNLSLQSPIPSIKINIPASRQRSNLINNIAQKLDLNEAKLNKLLKDEEFLRKFKPFNKESIYCIFISGKYDIPKNTNEEDLIYRMHEQFLNFWNEERIEKAESAKLTPVEATILASIVYAETKHTPEMPAIAGVYINRLNNNMKLESDPTLVYATGAFSSRRVYKNRKQIFPEYNTYNKKGLPPGPVHGTTVTAIEAVLDYHDHEYLFFCAKDNTGTHNFASSYDEHKINAQKFRSFLNSKKIF